MLERKLRYRVATFATSKEGDRSWGIGGRIGYWPCVQGPFIQFGIGFRRISVWWGTEYEEDR